VEVPGIQGISVSVDYTSAGGASQEYIITDTAVENSNLVSTVNNIPWTVVDSFINSTTTSTHYMLRTELDGSLAIVFGDGVFGKSPAMGDSINLTYIRSAGLAGNAYSTDLITVVGSTIYDQAGVARSVTVTNTSTFLGGDDAETIEDIRTNAPHVFATGDRYVTKEDFIAGVGAYPSVGDVNVWGEAEEVAPNYDNFNQVKICVILQNWILPDDVFKQALSTYLYTKSLMTVRYSYVAPVILEVIPSLSIKASPRTSLSFLQAQIDAALASRFVLGTTTQLGTDVYHSDIVASIEGVAGVVYSHATLKIRKQLLSSYNSTYDWSQTMDIVPLALGGVELYIDDTRIASDDGAGSWTASSSSYAVTGYIDYTTGLVGANISPAPAIFSNVYCRYQPNQAGDIIVGLNQICRYISTEYYKSLWTIKHIRAGEVIWEDVGYNSLTQQGEEAILETFFRAGAAFTPTEFYVRLCNYSPLVTDTLSTLSGEPNSFGYAGQLLERSTIGFPTKTLTGDGNYRLITKVITFTASGGNIGPVTNAFLATTASNTGKLLAFRSLSMQRTILDGDSMTIQFQIDLS
jgi:hypothetical protein